MPCATPTEFATVFIVPPRRSATLRERRARVDVEKPGQRDVVGPVAAADGEDVDLGAAEVLGDAVELVDAAGLAHDAVVAQPAREAERGAGVAQVAPALGLRTTPMPDTRILRAPR